MSPANSDNGDAKLTRREIRARERARLEAGTRAVTADSTDHYVEPEVFEAPVQHVGSDHYGQAGHHPGQEHRYGSDDLEPARLEPEHAYVPARSGNHEPYYPHDDYPSRFTVEAETDGYYVDEDSHHFENQTALPGSTAVKAPSRKVRHRRRVVAVLLTLALFVTAIVVGVQFLRPLLGMDTVSDYAGPGTGEVQLAVAAGEGTRSFAAKLEDAGVIADADTFEGAFTTSGKTLSPGDYVFREEMSNAGAIAVLTGEDVTKVIYFALNAGLRINESLEQISKGAGVAYSELQALSNAPAQFGLPATAKNLEGFLAPGEYRFEVGTSAKDILQELVDVTVNELTAQGITDPAKQYEAVIVASIVQAEGGLADYGNVAGAIYNRLKPNDETNGYLQVDSAVTYGLGTKSFNFTEEERADTSNLYNTYANPGLPPGPIGSPGKTAIDAAAKPAINSYLYWVTVNLDSKETKFSSTLAEHNRYVQEYNAWCEANAGRCT